MTDKDFFTYDTEADLLADARRLGCTHVRLAPDPGPLLQPITVGGRRLGNRMAIHPMEGCDGTPDGRPGEMTIRRWERFAAGGSKLIWGEAVAVTDDGRANPRQLLIDEHTERDLADLVARTRRVHAERFGGTDDLLLVCQLTHSGRYSCRRPIIAMRDPGLDPVTFLDRKAGIAIPADHPVVTDEWLEQLEDRFVEAARRAIRAGFDAVDIKQCHRYLLNELLAGHTRPGRYGGSFENRTRFIRNVAGKIRARLGDVMLCSRIGAFDGVPFRMDPADGEGRPRPFETPYRHGWGTRTDDPMTDDPAEPVAFVRLLRDLGFACLNISMGNPYANPHVGRPFELPPIDGYPTPEHPLIGCDRHFRIAAAMQRAVPDLPMVGSGYSWLRHFAAHVGAANVAAGDISIVGVGRGAFAYPEWAAELSSKGTMDKKRVCIAVSMCTTLMRAKGNDLGQFPSGCVPRDKFYAPVYKDALKTLPGGVKPKAETAK